MDIEKVLDNGAALVRGSVCLFFKKLFNFKRVHYKANVRMFSRSKVSVYSKGSVTIGKGLKLGKNSTLTAQGGSIVIGDGVGINRDVLINAHELISIGDNTIIAPRVCIYDHDHIYDVETGVHKKEFKTTPISIGKNVWIGANAVILRGSEIGDNCVVGAGCVIKGKVPMGTVIVQKRESVRG